MNMDFGGWVALLVYAAFAFKILGYLARDELLLRALMLVGTFFYVGYYSIVAEQPLWDAIYTNAALAAANMVMIGVVIAERSTFSMTSEMAALYRMFPLMTPGQFRQLLRAAEEVTYERSGELVREGTHPDRLFFVIDGAVEIDKNGETIRATPGIFIGEIAWLTGQAASATVRVDGGSRVLRWDSARLEKALRRSPNLRAALVGHLNMDLAHKVARSQPLAAAG